LVYNPSNLDAIDPKTQAAKIGGTVGGKKRATIIEKADQLKIRVLNR
jgi:large subunit ribosomal protein L32e